MKKTTFALLALLVTVPFTQATFAQSETSADQETTLASDTMTEEQAYQAWAEQFLNSLNPQTGTIELPGGIASLDVPENFYYLSPEDAKKILEDAWGNPPSELSLGMLFPAAYTPLDGNSWGVTIDFEQQGYVSDEDAADIDYNDLLEDMQADTREESTYRQEQGFESLELVGWAAQPYYDANTHKLYWAKELRFGDMDENTLNYNVRALGRRGVLVMNFIASMPQLEEIEASRDQVLAMATFNDGHRYSQFNPDMDEVAAYGIGGLIAGKVLAKTGFLAIALVFLKKFWFILLLPLIWLKDLVLKKKTTDA